MDIFEYLPQLIVAYDGNDEFANLIHVKKANKDNNYFCPCCGGSVKPRALDSTKEQSHYYHVTGKCTKESQLHFFCKNWLFEKGSKFYIDNNLFEVSSIDIEKTWKTQFGDYKPDISVYTTSGEIIYFEMFFSNRKTGDDYFCKWNALGNDVVEVNIKEYMFKTDEKVIPTFKYLYHDGVCYSKTYEKRDLYANTIARIKREFIRQKAFNYKARIEQLDWFWKSIQSNDTRESILEILSAMTYEDLLSCYEIIKRKQCVLYLKNDVINMINQKVLDEVRKTLDLPHDENIYFDLEHIKGRTYKAGIRLSIKTEHITYNDLYSIDYWCDFNRLKSFPKVVFAKNIFSKNELVVPDKKVRELQELYEIVHRLKESILEHEKELSDFEKTNNYKIRVKNNSYTVVSKIHNDSFDTILEHYYLREFDVEKLALEIEKKVKELNEKELLYSLKNNPTCLLLINELQNYRNTDCFVDLEYEKYKNGVYVKLYLGDSIYYYKMDNINLDEFTQKIECCKKKIDELCETYNTFIDLVDKINSCKNNIWKAKISFKSGNVIIQIDQKIFDARNMKFTTYENVYFNIEKKYTKKKVIKDVVIAMYDVMKNMEVCGYRIMEVNN